MPTKKAVEQTHVGKISDMVVYSDLTAARRVLMVARGQLHQQYVGIVPLSVLND